MQAKVLNACQARPLWVGGTTPGETSYDRVCGGKRTCIRWLTFSSVARFCILSVSTATWLLHRQKPTEWLQKNHFSMTPEAETNTKSIPGKLAQISKRSVCHARILDKTPANTPYSPGWVGQCFLIFTKFKSIIQYRELWKTAKREQENKDQGLIFI